MLKFVYEESVIVAPIVEKSLSLLGNKLGTKIWTSKDVNVSRNNIHSCFGNFSKTWRYIDHANSSRDNKN